MIDKQDVIRRVKKKLDLPADSGMHDDLIEEYVDEMGQRIINYTNQPRVPDGLKYVWVSMAAAALAGEQMDVLNPPTAVTEEVYEISIGDTSVKPASSKVSTATAEPSLITKDSVLFDYRGELNAYRRMRW